MKRMTALLHVPLCLTALVSGQFAQGAISTPGSISPGLAVPPAVPREAVNHIKTATPQLVTRTNPATGGLARKRHKGKTGGSSLARISAVNRAATLNAESAPFQRALEIMPYAEGAIYDLHAAPERITDILLEPGEVLASVACGDTSRWIIGDTSSGSGEGKRVHILVKPSSPNLATNLLITTDRRSYHVNLRSNAHVATTAMSWSYPNDALLALTNNSSSRTAPSMSTRLAPERLNFNYVISGDRPRWRPVRAFDDGQKTYIEFSQSIATDEAPPLFLISGKDAELVNYRMQGRFYIVDRLFTQAELRLGTKRSTTVVIRRTDEGLTKGSSRP
ncbi:P-type conjugative transfer protein TrbG [Sphingobium phenoxybenzoativorans]|uniref:P-type conjugative transfer protein TrbG n=1 Tax=Sphingobium phenoxybenzoativorans TaxID=1592790 RepID=UPI000AA1DAF5|nr:P-type conjugative transfer protein TrbG [Sphingobium phenoxybenzoativorans]